VYQLRDNLFNEVDMVTEDDRRWKFGQYFSWCEIFIILKLFNIWSSRTYFSQSSECGWHILCKL
jgi:hypothetical protein